jgi:homopolymeric O-antigen transport system permease protein
MPCQPVGESRKTQVTHAEREYSQADQRDQFTRIDSAHNTFLSSLVEAGKRRCLVGEFVRRDIRIRYKQTMLGASWAVLQPLLTMVVFTLVFGRMAKVPSEGIPYPVFVLCGLLPWQLFARGLVRSGNCLVEERYLLTRVYVPRLILPASAVLAGLVDFSVGFLVLLAMIIHYGVGPSMSILWVVPLLLLALITTLGAGLFLSAWNVRYRDVGHTLPFFVQLWLFLTPVAYPSALVPAGWRFLYSLNPMAAVVEGFRRALAGSAGTDTGMALGPALCASALFLLGLACFLRMDRTFADVV